MISSKAILDFVPFFICLLWNVKCNFCVCVCVCAWESRLWTIQSINCTIQKVEILFLIYRLLYQLHKRSARWQWRLWHHSQNCTFYWHSQWSENWPPHQLCECVVQKTSIITERAEAIGLFCGWADERRKENQIEGLVDDGGEAWPAEISCQLVNTSVKDKERRPCLKYDKKWMWKKWNVVFFPFL